MTITNYIKERIGYYEEISKQRKDFAIMCRQPLLELQAVLSKIEELERNEFEKIVQVNSKS